VHTYRVHRWDDQRHLNAIRHELAVAPLPLPLFPNGQYWAQHKAMLAKQPHRFSPYGTTAHTVPALSAA
jgi:hypothetical protein